MNIKTRNIIDLVLNIVIIFSTGLAAGLYFTSGPDILGSSGTDCFKYFTTDSNVLVSITAIFMFVFNIKRIKNPSAEIPKWVTIIKFVGTVSVAVTFITVIIFLGPIACIRGSLKSFLRFYQGNTFALHFSTPVLSMISVILFEKDNLISFKNLLWSLIPTVLYSIVYLFMVAILKTWNDWYGFTFGGKWYMIPLSMIGMYVITFVIALVLRKLRRTNN